MRMLFLLILLTMHTLADDVPPQAIIDFSRFTPETVGRIFQGMRDAIEENRAQQAVIVKANIEIGKRAADAEARATTAEKVADSASTNLNKLQQKFNSIQAELEALKKHAAALQRFCHVILTIICVAVSVLVWMALRNFNLVRVPLIGGWLSGYALLARIVIAASAGAIAATVAWTVLSRL